MTTKQLKEIVKKIRESPNINLIQRGIKIDRIYFVTESQLNELLGENNGN